MQRSARESFGWCVRMHEHVSTIRGIEQGRARFAYDKVMEANQELGEQGAQKYKSYVRKLPMYIKTNGIGATLAFIKAKTRSNKEQGREQTKDAQDRGQPEAAGQEARKKADDGKVYACIYRQLGEWLRVKQLLPAEEKELVVAVVSLRSPEYRIITNEVMAFLGWLSRFAEGMIEGEADGED